MKKIRLVLMGIAVLVLASVFGRAAAAEEEKTWTNSAMEAGVTITIGTDKKIYKEGEEVHYKIVIENNSPHTKIDKFTFNYSNSAGLEAAAGTALPNEVPILDEGGVYTLEGTLVGDVSKFAENTYVAPGTGLNIPQKSDIADAASGTSGTGGDGDNTSSSAWSGVTLTLGIVAAFFVLVLAVVVLLLKRKKKPESEENGGKKKTDGNSSKDGNAKDGNAKNGNAKDGNAQNGNGIKGILIFLIGAAALTSAALTGKQDVQAASEYDTVTLRPYVKFIYADHEVMVRGVMELHLYQKYISVESSLLDNPKKISCHDPSIFKAPDGKYYIFGTHITAAVSDDLKAWTSMDATYRNALSADVRKQIRAWNKDETAGNWYDYLWAPDIIYNPAMGKYCMYISANGDDWKSNIVLVTSDHVEGPYDYVGTVVYGGFDAENFTETDAPAVMGTDTLPDDYIKYGVKNKKWGDKWPNCIDPCVFFDDEGRLWMSYGSWSGGIFLLALDKTTGLRDYSVTYASDLHSDVYFGKKIAGGAYVSGEASYIQKIGDYYYLFISYGNLEAAGGYNVRVFRSSTPDGEYLDALGNNAFSDKYTFNYNTNKGVRLFGGYKWRTFVYGQVAQGHNSAFVDDDGKAYIVFHTRTTNGSEYHYVKAHQLFVNREGWIVAAPYQTSGETIKENGYSVAEVAGEYDVILHELDINFKHLEVNKTQCVFLNEDGTVSGAFTGTWSLDNGTPYIDIKVDGVNYSGVVLEMNVENTKVSTMVFTGLGDSNQLTIWGSKVFE